MAASNTGSTGERLYASHRPQPHLARRYHANLFLVLAQTFFGRLSQSPLSPPSKPPTTTSWSNWKAERGRAVSVSTPAARHPKAANPRRHSSAPSVTCPCVVTMTVSETTIAEMLLNQTVNEPCPWSRFYHLVTACDINVTQTQRHIFTCVWFSWNTYTHILVSISAKIAKQAL